MPEIKYVDKIVEVPVEITKYVEVEVRQCVAACCSVLQCAAVCCGARANRKVRRDRGASM